MSSRDRNGDQSNLFVILFPSYVVSLCFFLSLFSSFNDVFEYNQLIKFIDYEVEQDPPPRQINVPGG